MVHRRTPNPLSRTAGRARRAIPALLVFALVLGGAPQRAHASGDGNTVGNGRGNRNNVSINSPEFNHGIQHITNQTVGGRVDTQASFCKRKFRHCHIVQRIGGGWAP